MLGDNTGAEFEAWVGHKETGQRLHEYQVVHHPAAEGQSAWSECFLETIDEPFQIKVTKPGQPSSSRRRRSGSHRQALEGIECTCTVDGESLRNCIWFLKDKDHGWNKVYEKDEVDGKLYKASLNFAPLTTTDDPDKITIDNAKLQHLGIIEVTLHRGYYMPAGVSGIRTSKIKVDTADERAKKTSDREEVQDTMRSTYRFFPYHPLVKDYRFVFKYRPRAMLVHSGMIDEPIPPQPQGIPQPARPRQKRKRNSVPSEAILVSDDEGVGRAIKPDLEKKRVRYLEEQVKKLSLELSSLKEGGKSKVDAVDLTLDDIG